MCRKNFNSATSLHSSDNLPSYLQTNIIAQMLSLGWEGVSGRYSHTINDAVQHAKAPGNEC